MRLPSRFRRILIIIVCGSLLVGYVAARTISLKIRGHEESGSIPTPTASPQSTPVTSTRDLSQYENGGSFAVNKGATESSRREALSPVRSFLLRKWNERGPGHIAIETTSPTGKPVTGSFYVEQDEAGTWRVVLETAGRATEKFYFVEEVDIDAAGRPVLERRRNDPQPTSRALHLKKSAGANSGLVL